MVRLNNGSGSGGGGDITLETNGVLNGDQTLLNLVAGTNMTITDDGLGNVTFDSSGAGGISIGDGVGGSNPNVVLYMDTTNRLAQSGAFLFDDTLPQLLLGGIATPLDGSTNDPLVVSGDDNSYIAANSVNRNSGDQATADVVVANDADDGTVLGGHYGNMGINSSTYDNTISNDYALGGPNDGYFYVNGGSVNFATQKSHTIRWSTGGLDQNNLRMVLSESSPTLTLGIETVASGTLALSSNNGTNATLGITVSGSLTPWIFQFPDDAGTSGYVLQTDGSGQTSWVPAGGSGSLVVGTTTITGGSDTNILYNNLGVLGEYTVTGTGTVVVLKNSPSLSAPDIGVASGTSLTATGVLSSGTNGGTGGQLKLNGATSGEVILKVAAAAGTGTVFQLPANNGTNTYVLQTDGAGVTSWVAPSGGGVSSVSGTANRITSTGGATPVIDIASTYVGQNSITTLGTITTGVWNGTAIANANLANSSLTIGSTNISLGATSTTLAGLSSVTSTTFVGALTGNASTATALDTPRTIGTITGDATSAGSSFDGSANNTNALTLATVNSNVGTFTNATITVNAKGLITAASTGSGGSGITIGTTTITSGTNTRILYNNSGVVGEYTLQGTGTAVVMATSPTITTPTIAKLANLTTNGFVKTSGGDGTLSVDTGTYLSDQFAARSMYANGTNATATAVAKTWRDDGLTAQTLPTPTFTAGTAPSSNISNQYTWTQVGKLVTMNFYMNYTTPGATVAAARFALPSDMPAPLTIASVGASANEFLYMGCGYIGTQKTTDPSVMGRVSLMINAANNGYDIKIQSTSVAARVLWGTIQYFAA